MDSEVCSKWDVTRPKKPAAILIWFLPPPKLKSGTIYVNIDTLLGLWLLSVRSIYVFQSLLFSVWLCQTVRVNCVGSLKGSTLVHLFWHWFRQNGVIQKNLSCCRRRRRRQEQEVRSMLRRGGIHSYSDRDPIINFVLQWPWNVIYIDHKCDCVRFALESAGNCNQVNGIGENRMQFVDRYSMPTERFGFMYL